jgi:ribosomal protein S18 acetylase RimI-like enzyme
MNLALANKMSTAEGSPREDTVKIRRLVADEWKSYRNLRLRALKVDPMAFGSDLRRESTYTSDKWMGWAESGASGDEAATFVIEAVPGRLVGMAGLYSDEGKYHLWGMWVAPEYRGRGLGSKLLDRVLSWAEVTRPNREVRLDVNPTQAVAVRLYESRGFRSSGKTLPLGHHPPAVVEEMRRGQRIGGRGKRSKVATAVR